MKFSAIFFSVNLVAVTMPLAAQAAEEAVSDKAAWLKQSIAAMETAKKPTSRKISLSDPGITPVSKTPKLRPFVANRKLPSARDFELSAMRPKLDTTVPPTLTAQQPTLGQPDKPLSAQISAYALDTLTDSRTAAAPLPAALRAVPGHVPSLPGQIASRSISAPAIPVIPEPPIAAAAAPAYMNLQPPAPPRLSRLPASIQPERLIKQAGALLVQAPALSPDERHLVDELVQLNQPGHSRDFIDVQGGRPVDVPGTDTAEESQAAPQASLAGHSDVGPPPFPLNLLPQDQLQDFVGRRKQQKISAPPVYFGSWHRQASAQNTLPYAGFQTHLQSRRILATNYNQYAARMGTQQSTSSSRRSKRTGNTHHSAVSHSSIAVYPAYENVSRVSMF